MEQWFYNHLPSALVLIGIAGGTLVQISPIQINPWTALLRWIGRAINGELIKNVTELQTSLNAHIKTDNDRYFKQCRMRVLRFNDEILQHQRHTKEHFDEILGDITEYEKYCDEHPDFKNNKAVLAINNIKRVYKECMQANDFL